MTKIIKILSIIVSLLLLSGCNYKEINDYAIVSGISIDLSADNKYKYEIGIQIMNAKKDEESTNSSITTYNAKANTIYQALAEIMLKSPRQLYLGHNEVIILSNEILKKENPLNYLDYFIRATEVSKDTLVIATKNEKAYDVLKIITPLETIPSKNLKYTILNADVYNGFLTTTTIDEFVSFLQNDGVEAVIPTVSITGNISNGQETKNIEESSPNTKLNFSSLSYFKGNKLKGMLTKEESNGYSLLNGNAKKMNINVKCDKDNYATINISYIIHDKILKFKNKKPYVYIKNNITSSLVEYNCKADFMKDKKVMEKLEKKVEKKINNSMNQLIKRIYINEKNDLLGYGNTFYKRKYHEMKKNNYTKKNIINDLNFIYKTNVLIRTPNLAIKSIKED